MGLHMSTKNKSWSHSYGSFGAIRKKLGELTGVSLDEMEPYSEKGLIGFWLPDDEVDDDLIILQSHYDHDGILMPYTAGKIAARVRRILSESDIDAELRDIIVQMVEVFEDAEENWEVVMFG